MEEKLVELLRELENAVMAFSRATSIEECQGQIEKIHEARFAVIGHVQGQLQETMKEGFNRGASVAAKHLAWG